MKFFDVFVYFIVKDVVEDKAVGVAKEADDEEDEKRDDIELLHRDGAHNR